MADHDQTWWPAPAKINLFLHVLGRRPDGYHDIQTLFQLLDWGDEIGIRVLSNPGISRLPVSYGVPEPEDLVTRAARLLQAEADVRLGAEIAVAMATGDKLQSCSLGLRHYVLVFPDFPIATRELFEDPDLKRDSRLLTLQEILSGSGRNDFEPLVRKRFPVFDETMRILQKWGKPVMTGTGSGIFIPMRDKKSAKSAARAIKSLYNVRAVQGVDLSPLHEKLD